MPNIQPPREHAPEGYVPHGPNLYLVPAMATGAALRYQGQTLTETQWGGLLRRMRFAPQRIPATKATLSNLYTAPLSFDQWCYVFEHLAVEHVLATNYPHLQ